MSVSPVIPTSNIKSESSVLFRQKWEEKSPPVSEAGKRVTLQEYWDLYYDHEYFAYEWNNGILEEKPMTDYESLKQYRWFLCLLEEYLKSNPVAEVIGLELGMKLSDSVRKPDIGLIRKDNPNPFLPGDNKCKGPCDLSIESLSTSSSTEIKRDTVTKKREYAKNGITEYFILDYRHIETAFYRLNTTTNRYNKIPPRGKDIIESEVLPGFRFRLSDLKTQTPRETLVKDPVYAPYVNPEYQAEHKKRKKERLRADQEALRADQAEKEKEKALLQAKQERKEKEAERLGKEKALLQAERERQEKEQALLQAEEDRKEIEQLKKLLAEKNNMK